MAFSGIGQLVRSTFFVDGIVHLGYPLYVLTIFGVCKILGAAAVVAPGLPRLKEWAYAGFCFLLLGGTLSHLFRGDGLGEAAPSAAFGALTLVSWASRPASRRLP